MIESFAHKGLELFFLAGDMRGIHPKHAARLSIILATLDAAAIPFDMTLPGFNLHALTGDMKGIWSVKVSGNWRVTFRFKDGSAYVVNYLDYY